MYIYLYTVSNGYTLGGGETVFISRHKFTVTHYDADDK